MASTPECCSFNNARDEEEMAALQLFVPVLATPRRGRSPPSSEMHVVNTTSTPSAAISGSFAGSSRVLLAPRPTREPPLMGILGGASSKGRGGSKPSSLLMLPPVPRSSRVTSWHPISVENSQEAADDTASTSTNDRGRNIGPSSPRLRPRFTSTSRAFGSAFQPARSTARSDDHGAGAPTQPPAPEQQDLSWAILRHVATSNYHNLDDLDARNGQKSGVLVRNASILNKNYSFNTPKTLSTAEKENLAPRNGHSVVEPRRRSRCRDTSSSSSESESTRVLPAAQDVPFGGKAAKLGRALHKKRKAAEMIGQKPRTISPPFFVPTAFDDEKTSCLPSSLMSSLSSAASGNKGSTMMPRGISVVEDSMERTFAAAGDGIPRPDAWMVEIGGEDENDDDDSFILAAPGELFGRRGDGARWGPRSGSGRTMLLRPRMSAPPPSHLGDESEMEDNSFLPPLPRIGI